MKKFRRILVIITIIGLLISTFQLVKRFSAEQRNTVVEIVADYEDFSEIAVETDMTIKDTANDLISSGVTSIAISEESLLDMENDGEILIYSGVDLKYLNVHFNNEYFNIASNVKEYIDNNLIDYSNVTLVLGNNLNTYDFLKNSFKARFKDATVNFNEGNNFCILINRNIGKVKNVGLGLVDADFEEAKKLGFTNIIPRIENHEGITEDEVDELYNQLKKYNVQTVIFAGVTVFGQDYQDEDEKILKYIGEKFSKRDSEIITAIIERPAETDLETVQRGITNLAKYSKYVNTKVFSTDLNQLQKLSYEGLAEQWGRAISQRNVRVLYVRPLDKAEKTTQENYEETLKAIKEIKNRVGHMGMTLGNAKGFGTVNQNPYLQLVMALGVCAAGILLILLVFEEERLEKFQKVIYFLSIAVLLGVAMIYLIPFIYNTMGDLMNKLIAFAASIIFASLAGVWIVECYRNTNFLSKSSDIRKGSMLLVVSALIAILGGIYIGAILSSSKYILKLDTFRGVKLSFLLPLVIWGFTYVIKVGFYRNEEGKPLTIIEQCKKFFEEKVTVKYVAIVGVILGALALIVMRSGNTMTSSASSIELMFRNFLEKYLVARPRTKELIAFPILFLIPYLAKFKNREIAFIAMGGAMIGVENIINSFCHIRMPIFITSLSTIYSLIFAIIIGSICVVVLDKIIVKLMKK